jgi:voltage-gated potassium channel Kch
MARPLLGWVVRGTMLVGVFLLGLYAFRAGVCVTDRPGLAHASLPMQVYYTAGLFVMGGMDLGTPAGGPLIARTLLWVAYFAAPLITTSAVIEGALKLVGSGTFERWALHRHVVVVGLGRLGTSFVNALREWDEHVPILALDRNVSQAAVAQARRRMRITVMQGDVRLRNALGVAHLDRARGVALMTDDDLLNLEVAFRLSKAHPELPVVAHVSDVAMERAVREVSGAQRVFVFNAHRMAAKRLYDDHLSAYFQQTTARDAIVLAGFGRFGQTIFEYLDREAHGEIARVVLIDREAQSSLRKYLEHAPLTSCAPRPLDADLADPETWERVATELAGTETPPAIVVGSDNDVVNLKAALHARRRWPAARLFVRCQNESSFTETLARHHGIEPIVVDSILLDALKSKQRDWFD